MDNNNLKEKFKFRIAISELIEESEKNIYKKQSFINKKVIAACACIILTSGIVFAKDIEDFIKDKFKLGKGIQTAIDNGYIEHIEEDYMYQTASIQIDNNVIDSCEIGLKINDFLVTDTNLSIEFEAKFDNKINKYKDFSIKKFNNTDFESFGYIELQDLLIFNDKNELLYSTSNLSSMIENNSTNNSISFANSSILEIDEKNNVIKFIYNIGINNLSPSDYISIKFNNFAFINKPLPNNNKSIVLKSNWEFKLTVPEFMYNNDVVSYKVTNCKNKDFEIYEAKATDTGFEIGIIVSNVEKPTMPQKLEEKYSELVEQAKLEITTRENFIKLFGDEEYANMYEDYMNKLKPISTNGYRYNWGNMTGGCYVLNSNGNNFKCAINNINRKAEAQFIEGSKYKYYNTFEMTKYDITDKIIFIVDFYGKPVEIELEKIQ